MFLATIPIFKCTDRLKILVVEDSPAMTLMISSALDQKYQVTCVSSSATALEAVGKSEFNFLILDFELPDEDGLVLMSKIRMNALYQDTPVFFLSGSAKTSDKLLGFTLGADDYLVKPVDPIELQIRIDSRIRRASRDAEKNLILKKGPFSADLERQRLTVRSGEVDTSIELTPIEFKLFLFFLRKEDRIMSRDQILQEIWPHTEVSDRTVDSHIYTLRKKLGKWSGCIEAVSRVGYRFVGLTLKLAS